MARTLLAVAATLGMVGAAVAQGAGSSTAPESAANAGPGIRGGHITSTGETVPNPGASQGAGTTPLDLGVQSRDNKIDSSICKGC